MPASLKISVIAVVWNTVETIEDTIQSVLSQKHPLVEHIVIDGASTDGTVDIIKKYKAKITKFVSEPDHGLYDAMNKGIAQSTGDVIGFLNADDVYAEKDILEQVASTFTDSNIDACYADLVYVDQNNLNKIVRYWKSRPYQDGLFEKGWMPAHPTFFIRRSVYEKYGNFDLNYHFQSDFELTMRFLAIHKIRSIYIPRVFVKMRMGGVSNNRLSSIIRGNLEAYRVCKKHGLSVTPLFFIKKIGSRIPQFFMKMDTEQ